MTYRREEQIYRRQVKKRSGNHEHTIREFKLSSEGISVGPPLTNFSGIFSGTPRYIGEGSPLLPVDDNGAR